MTETSWFLRNLDTTNLAYPCYYSFSDGQYKTNGHSNLNLYPPGQLKTSAIHLAHFLSAFLGHGQYKGARILDSATVDSITRIQYPGTEPIWAGWGFEWGLGWYRRNWTPGPPEFWGHEGEIFPGVRTFMYGVPAENTGAIMLTNSTDALYGPGAIFLIYDLVWEFSRDSDQDGLIAGFDNCPNAYNPGQEDADQDGYPDACEPDVDHDGVLVGVDNCALIYNPDQADADADAVGDLCDSCTDRDGDGYGDAGFAANTCELDSCSMLAIPGNAHVTTGDVNVSGSLTSADIIYLVNHVFKGGPAPLPVKESGDVNCSKSLTSADIIHLVNYVFKSGAAPCDVCALVPGA
jgi:hypothetical protein